MFGEEKSEKEQEGKIELDIFSKGETLNKLMGREQVNDPEKEKGTTEQPAMKFQILADKPNHPVKKPSKDIYSLKDGQDAVSLVTKIGASAKREEKRQFKAQKRIKDTIRLKYIDMDTKEIMNQFDKGCEVKLLNADKLREAQRDQLELLIDNQYQLKAKELDEDDDYEDSNVSDSALRGKQNDKSGYIVKRYAKEDKEIQKDILTLYQAKDQYTWDDLKNEMSDQPEAALKKQINTLCDKVSGTGGRTLYKLKDAHRYC